MLRKLFLVAILALSATPALAQNTTCSDRPAADSSNACANTRFVHGYTPTNIPPSSIALPDGQIIVGNGSGLGQGRTMSGDCTMTDLGVISCTSSGGVTSFQGLTGAVAVASSNNNYYVCATGNDANDGLSWQSCKLTIQAALTAGGTGATVNVGAGTYNVPSPNGIRLFSNQRLTCVAGATITQANGANVPQIVDLFTNSAANVTIDHCTFDGNRANNTVNANNNIVDGTAGGLLFVYNNVNHSTGGGVNVQGKYNNISFNRISDTYVQAIGIGGNVSDLLFNKVIGNIITGPVGNHAITNFQGDYNIIAENHIYLPIIGGSASSMIVNISGSTVTWVSGTNFASAQVGHVLVANGQEFTITGKSSNTSLTVSPTASLTNKNAAIGTGDLISIQSASYDLIANNVIYGGVTGGIVFSNELSSTESVLGTQVHNNKVMFSGTCGICLQANTNGSTNVTFSSIIGNHIFYPGWDGLATTTVSYSAISLYSQTVGLASRITVDDNVAIASGNNSGDYWLTDGGGATAANVVFGRGNIASGFANNYNMSGYPKFASLPPAGAGATGFIIDGITSGCSDSTCTTFGTSVTAGGGALKLNLWNNGTNWTLVGK